MITDRKLKIEEFTENKSIRLRESYISKHCVNIYNEILEYTKDISDIPFLQKIWHWMNYLPIYYLCACGNRTIFTNSINEGYRIACSAKCAQSNQEVKNKRKNTTIEKYGVDNISKLEQTKEKMYATNLEKYGTKSSFQNPLVRKKWSDNMLEKHGVDHFFKTEEFKISSKKYYLEKYGVDHQLKIDDVKEKIKNTCLERYGVETYLNTKHSRDSIKSYNRSSYEEEICEWLSSNDVVYIHSSRNIAPLLLDIYIPGANLAIEFNGLYWHSEFKKSKDYHLNKTILCNNAGIELIHIWQDDWLNRKNILKSIILNRLSLIKNRIPARKCKIVELDNERSSIFLNNNHIQGYCRYNMSIGLEYKGEIVSIMSFGYRSINGKKEYELIRFCNKIDNVVIGSASKLFKYFTSTNIQIDSITSYSDVSIFSGSLYKILGFKNIRRSDINYWWVVNGIRKHRFNYNKKKLVKMGYDPLMTEVEIMHSLNNYRVFGCGQDKWIWYRY